MNHDDVDTIIIRQSDLDVLATVVMHRFTSAQLEAERIERVRALLTTALQLSRALEEQIRYVMVDHRGSHGANDLSAATQVLYRGFADYACALHGLGGDYAEFANERAIGSLEPASR